MCKKSGERGESLERLARECKKLAQKEYKRRRDGMEVMWKVQSEKIPDVRVGGIDLKR